MGVLTALVVAVVGQIVTIVWTFEASRAAECRQSFGRNWSNGWAIGGWFWDRRGDSAAERQVTS
jgi:hypothetical protein